jgi:hypothetical protein
MPFQERFSSWNLRVAALAKPTYQVGRLAEADLIRSYKLGFSISIRVHSCPFVV